MSASKALPIRSVASDDFLLLCEIVKLARSDFDTSAGPGEGAPLLTGTGVEGTARPALANLLTEARIPGLISRAARNCPELRMLDTSIVTIAEEQLALAADIRRAREEILKAMCGSVGHEIGPFLGLKGYAIEISCYNNSVMFLNKDIDIVIPRQIGELSYRSRDTISLCPSGVEFEFMKHHDLLSRLFKIPFEDIWKKSEETLLYEGMLHIPSPTDQLFLTCVSAFRHSYRFKDICYIDCILTNLDIDWERFWGITNKSNALKPVVYALLLADILMSSLQDQQAISRKLHCLVSSRLLQVLVARIEAQLIGGESRKKPMRQVVKGYYGSRLNMVPARQKAALLIESITYRWLHRHRRWADILRSGIKRTNRQIAGDIAVVYREKAIFFEDVSLNRSCPAGKIVSWILEYHLRKKKKLDTNVDIWSRNMPFRVPGLGFYLSLFLSLRGIMSGTAEARAKHTSWRRSA